MTVWPTVDRAEPPYVAGERAMLEAWLEFHRATLLNKCAGLTGEQLALRSVPPSSLSLLGLVRHLAEVENGWFRSVWDPSIAPLYDDTDDVDVDLNDTDPARADEDLARYVEQLDLCRAAAATRDLDDVATRTRRGESQTISLRWVYVHMIEEYARHNGHADLLREAIDGVTGD
ncbi:DinB family protein [Spongisporangium articulatum]|uniref:DinB family protein n=1 Tax=Spongisporangium articulatum TaxID=3362603 RepID=A0ABW8AIW4_9ACTN